ncbi:MULTISPECIES: hypothetical protein [unclassified Colwellia]|jgi:hypothetical protein|uniref:hypothetical protein n=1 Tax=unclassified Colwellia TaxID=196834 RepID=UPI0015F3ABAE|nr:MULTISPECIES: hypothetical protein [unclassified Colwellia]MBA6252201.1 hypothetical protein [Colwellia sp. MB3u-55]MBA6398820.1 hypothetical protein [Colwellia sp. BRX10-4]
MILKIFTKLITVIIPLLFIQSSLFSPLTKAEDILIFIRDDVYQDYMSFLDGRDVHTIKNFSGKKIRRDVVDMIIAQQALKIGGFEHSFKYATGKINFRNTKMLASGRLLISFDSYWLADAKALNDSVYTSDAVIRQGEYIAGIYTSPSNSAVLAITEFEDLQKFTAVSTPKWRTDWQTLKLLSLKELIQEDEWLSQARMVNLGWIDFLLMPFNSTPDQSFTMDKIHLVPVKGVAIELKDSRHFVISTKHPHGKIAFKAINIGLKKLRNQHRIVQAFTQAGFFVSPDTVKILNRN